MIGERIVGGVQSRQRANAPATPHVRLHESLNDAAGSVGTDNAAPQTVPGIRCDRLDTLLVTVESKHITTDVFAPESVVESRLKPGSLRPQRCGPFGLTKHIEQLRGSHPRVEGIALQLAEGFRSLYRSSVRIDHGIGGVLPPHVFVTLRRSSLVFLELVAITIARSFDPLQAAQGRVAELTQQVPIAEPLPRLVQHDQI